MKHSILRGELSVRTVIVEYERALSLIGFRIGKDRSNSLASKKKWKRWTAFIYDKAMKGILTKWVNLNMNQRPFH